MEGFTHSNERENAKSVSCGQKALSVGQKAMRRDNHT